MTVGFSFDAKASIPLMLTNTHTLPGFQWGCTDAMTINFATGMKGLAISFVISHSMLQRTIKGSGSFRGDFIHSKFFIQMLLFCMCIVLFRIKKIPK